VVYTRKIAVLLAFSTTFNLTLVVVVASDVGNKVQRQSEKLLPNRMEQSSNRCFLGQLINFVDKFSHTASVLGTSLGNKDHVTLHVSCCLVVLSVGDFP